MQHVVFLANVGTQDLQLDGAKIAPPRLEAEKLLPVYEAVRDRLSAPILAPALRHAIQAVGRIHHVCLFVTDQPRATTPTPQWESDTLHFGSVLQRLLKDRFPGGIGEVSLAYMHGNPARYDVAMDYFKRELHTRVPPDRVAIAFVAPVGGVDACKSAMLLHAIRRYKHNCQPLYVMPDGSVEILNIHREVLGDYIRQQAAGLLDGHDYVALAHLLRQDPDVPPWLAAVCASAAHRLHFDFTRATTAIEGVESRTSGLERALAKRWAGELAAFQAPAAPVTSISSAEEWDRHLGHQRMLLAELYANLGIKRQREEWVDFLGRIFRMHEAILRLAVENQLRHSTEKETPTRFADFWAGVDKDSDLVQYLERKNVRRGEANSFIFSRLISCWQKRDEGRWKPISSAVDLIEQFSDLRNKSIIAHGYRGVSRPDLEAVAPLGELMETLRTALTDLAVSVSDELSPFLAVQRTIRAALERRM